MRIEHSVLRSVTAQILRAAGVDEPQVNTVTDNLVWCDMAGRTNHGVERLPVLVKRVTAGAISCPCSPLFKAHSPTMETLHAGNGFGHHAGRLAIDRTCDLAEESGIGVVGVTDSNFFGAGAYYVNRAAERGMVSLAMSNSFPKVAATGGLRPALGTNPLAFGAPRRGGHALLIDMSTAAVAGSTVREKISRGEQLEPGIAIDEQGHPILDPAKVAQGTLLPAAGAKGFGLAILVEVLSALLTGAGMAQQVASMYRDFGSGGHNGHFFLAMDVTRWLPLEDFLARMDLLSTMLADSGAPGEVRLPGDERWRQFADSEANGVQLETPTREQLELLAAQFGVETPWTMHRAPSLCP